MSEIIFGIPFVAPVWVVVVFTVLFFGGVILSITKFKTIAIGMIVLAWIFAISVAVFGGSQ